MQFGFGIKPPRSGALRLRLTATELFIYAHLFITWSQSNLVAIQISDLPLPGSADRHQGWTFKSF